MGQSSRAKRRQAWFDAGVRDLAATFGTPTTSGGTPIVGAYACPLCAVTEPDGRARMRLFTAEMLSHLLSFEDVPPKHSGGRPLVLTCRTCNNTAGHGVDAAADRVERSLRTLAGQEPVHGRLNVGNDEVPARIEIGLTDANRITILGGAPESLVRIAKYFKELTQKVPEVEPFRLSFQTMDPDDRKAKVSWLKSGYLALFALLGYRYAMHPFLGIVRQQIQQPAEEHLDAFAFRLPLKLPFSERRVFRIIKPELQPCWGVQMGPVLVFLPHGDPTVLYGRLTQLKAERALFEFHAQNTVWPLAPVFPFAEMVFGRREGAS